MFFRRLAVGLLLMACACSHTSETVHGTDTTPSLKLPGSDPGPIPGRIDHSTPAVSQLVITDHDDLNSVPNLVFSDGYAHGIDASVVRDFTFTPSFSGSLAIVINMTSDNDCDSGEEASDAKLSLLEGTQSTAWDGSPYPLSRGETITLRMTIINPSNCRQIRRQFSASFGR